MNGLFPAKKIYQVSELARELNQTLEHNFREVWVQGEISGLHKQKSGHDFFALRDKDSKLSAIMFHFQALYLKFVPEDGLEVLVRGYLSFYAPRGELRLIADTMEPVGIGALELAFEQVKKKLADEGLFDKSRKKTLPEFCRRIAIITSPTGAVFHDFMKIFREKNIQIEVLLIPSRVQGAGAEQELVEALQLANKPEVAHLPGRPELDLIVLARGGGSLEDLLPFNSEVVARAIAQSRIPVMSAIGHEVDYTIADLVADERAPTPTAAAERIAQSQENILRRLSQAELDLESVMQAQMEKTQHKIKDFMHQLMRFQLRINQLDHTITISTHQMRNALEQRVREIKDHLVLLTQKLLQNSPERWLQSQHKHLLSLSTRLGNVLQLQLNQMRERVSLLAGNLQVLSPLSTLERGYAIVRTQAGQKLITDQRQVAKAENLEVILHRGELLVKVEEKKEKNPWENYEPESEKE